jgi:hypothetical protein
VPLNITWGYYVSNEGDSVSGQPSGAYMFRPATQRTYQCQNGSQPTLTVTAGPLVTEIKQVFADWATHIVRLTKGSPYIEVEWTAGPIPMNAPPAPPPTPPKTTKITGEWSVGMGPATGKITESADGSFSVAAPSSKAWKSATGKVTGTHVVISFDKGPKNQHGTIGPEYNNIHWSDGTMWTRKGSTPTAGHLGGGKELVLKFGARLRQSPAPSPPGCAAAAVV